MVILIRGDWVQLSDVDHELQRCQWIESGVDVYRSTMSSVDKNDGADLPSR